ncbi:MAG TPA: pyrroline-5-carboxylate reductase [Azospirillum sp.]|nr:pyrroline-5-carboxylate reductase [Azospirillum sp.]
MNAKLLLVGCGKMGGAMLDGWLKAGTVERVVVVEPNGLPEGLANPAVTLAAGPDALPAGFVPDVVVLAVKPQAMDGVLPGYAALVGPQTVFLSIAAGKTIDYFHTHLGGAAAIVRAMPNTPAAVGRGITVAIPNAAVTAAQRDLCEALLRAVGEVAWADAESQMDAVTAVSGSGPAYVFHLVEALAAAGEAAGLPAELAQRLARATVSGSGELLHQSPAPAAQLREAVTSPGGTTRAALDVLMAPDGLTGLMTRAVAAAAKRSKELAQ